MNIFRYPIAAAWAVVAMVYWEITVIVPATTLIVFSDVLAIVTSLAVVVTYGPSALDAVMTRSPTKFHLIIVGITGGWLTNAIDRSIRLWSRLLGTRDLLDTYLIGGLLITLAMFASMHLMVLGRPGDLSERVSRRARIIAAAVLAVGAVLGAVVAVAHVIGNAPR